MPLPYFYIEHLDTDALSTLPEEASRHCIQVLRMKNGDRLNLTDGHGTLATAVIAGADRKHCTVSITGKTTVAPHSRPVSIAVSLLKNTARFEWFLEKATEIGVTEIIPLLCERTEKQHFRKDRMHHILVSAMLQSQQTWLPRLTDPMPFRELFASSRYPLRLIAHCETGLPKQDIRTLPVTGGVQVLIGPEGDFTPAEITLATESGYRGLSLGATRLRSETAAVAAAVLLALHD